MYFMYIDLLLIDEVHIKLTVLLLIIIMIASVSIVLKGNANAVFPSLPMHATGNSILCLKTKHAGEN